MFNILGKHWNNNNHSNDQTGLDPLIHITKEEADKLHYWFKKAMFNISEGNHIGTMIFLKTISKELDNIGA